MKDAGLRFVTRHKRLLVALTIVLVVYSLLGFALAPWLVKRTAVNSVQDQLGAELRIEKVAINPFVLSLRIDQLALDDPAGQAFLEVEQIFVNFQLSSLFRWALTFDEFRIDAPHAYLARDERGQLNAAFLAGSPDAAQQQPAEEDGGSAIPRLVVFKFAINDSVIDWDDQYPAERIKTRFGPVNFNIANLTTLPQKEGVQELLIATETQGTLSWQGSLQLNPLKSVGVASVTGSHLPLLSQYIRHDAGFNIARGDTDIELGYSIEVLADGTLAASIDDLSVTVSDLLLRTFTPQPASADAGDRDVLALPKLQLSGGTLRWPERSVAVQSLSVDDAIVSLYRDADGALNVLARGAQPADGASSQPDGEAATPAPASDSSWSVSLDEFNLRGAAIGLVDDSVTPAADIGVEELDIQLLQLSNKPDAVIPTRLTSKGRSGGSIAASGNVTVLPAPIVDLDLNIEGVSLAVLQSYLQSQADIKLDSGVLALTGKLHHGPDSVLRFSSDVAVTNFLVTETEKGSRLGSWTRLGLTGVKLDLEAASLDIASLGLDQPYADVFIAADGTVNLGRVTKGSADDNAVAAVEEPQPATVATDAEAESAFAVSIGEVVITDGSARFEDVSLPLPFAADIADLNGKITTIASASSQPANVSLEGKVDAYGLARISGTVTPLDPARNTDLKVVFQNVEMPKFSSYTIPFAGRKIASGKLDLDLGYQLDNGALLGENKIVLREFELGEKVEHPDAVSLPLGLAVALLKDSSGTIDIDLPVRGDLNEPEFSYGRVVGKALVSLIGKIVTSPFALLGNLVGIEGDELEFMTFEAGRSDLTPPEQERAAKLAEALLLRPELSLEVPAVADEQLDTAALKSAQLDALIDATADSNSDESATSVEQRAELLEQLYKELALTSDPAADLEGLQGKHTTVAEAGDNAGTAVFDQLAYAAELRERLIDLQVLGPDVLTGLATARAENTRAAVVAIDETLGARVAITEIDSKPDTEDGAVRMRVSLSVSD